MLSAISAGFALGPDIDHPNSTITRTLGRTAHLAFHGMSTAARTVLATDYDRRRFAKAEERRIDPSHRALTHTFAFTAVMGLFAYLVGHSALLTAALAALSVIVCRTLVPGRWQAVVFGAAAALAMFGVSVTFSPGVVALAATAGWLSHVIADSCTTAGVPVMWPLKVNGRYWWRLRLLGGWLRSGEPKEYGVALGISLVMNLPQLALI